MNTFYTIILHQARKKLGLSYGEYIAIDSISILSKQRKFDFWCVISDEKLAENLELSRATIKRAIKKGKKLGLIETEYGRKRTTDKWQQLTVLNEKYQNDTIDPEKYQNEPKVGSKWANSRLKVNLSSIIDKDKEIYREDIDDLKKLGKLFDRQYETINETAWQLWNTHMDEMGKKRTLSTIRLELYELLQSNNPAEMIRNSIRNGWRTLQKTKK